MNIRVLNWSMNARKKENITITLWNVEGLRSVLNVSPQNIFSTDIVILVETFLTEYINIQEYYNFHRLAIQGERGRPSGGISCLVKPWMTPYQTTYSSRNLLVIKVKGLFIICAYFQPESTAQDIIESLLDVMTHIDHQKAVVLAGDFNCRVDKDDMKSKTVIQFLEEEGLVLINNRNSPTYICHNGSSTIDLIFINSQSIAQDIKIPAAKELAPLRKHLPILASIRINTHRPQGNKKESIIIKRSLDISSMESATAIKEHILEDIQQGDIDAAALVLEDRIKKSQVKVNRIKRKSQAWFDAACYKTRREVLEHLHAAKRTKSNEALLAYTNQRRKYKCLLKEKKSAWAKEEEQKLVDKALKNQFEALKPKTPTFSQTISIQTWEKHFQQILDSKTRHNGATQQRTDVYPKITKEEVSNTIRSLKNHKAAGPDEIFNEHLKIALPYIGEVWTALFNKCLELSRIPLSWRMSTVKMLYKGKGCVDSPDSYRGIALENTIFKVFSKILLDRLIDDTSGIIPDQQYGFRKGRSTLHAIENLMSDIDDALRHHRGKFHVIFIDFKSAIKAITFCDLPRIPEISKCRQFYHSLIFKGKTVLQWSLGTVA